MTTIIDYGVGNLFSLACSLERIGEAVEITSDKEKIMQAERIILPGVGAFEDAAAKLRENGLDGVLQTKATLGTPILGICLGMQLLFEKSYEYGEHEGLGLIKGSVIPMKGLISDELKIPHIGWNKLDLTRRDELFKYVNEGDFVYFVHSYFGSDCEESVIATTEYGRTLTAAVRRDNVMGCQFHPEKSGKVGLSILKAFCEI